MSCIIALIYNWWNLYVRLALPDHHHEAISSRPLLLSSIGRLSKHRSQKTITITSLHGRKDKLIKAYKNLTGIFNDLKAIAPQLNPNDYWRRFLAMIMAALGVRADTEGPPCTPLLS